MRWGEAIRRYYPNADGLACGGSNRQPGMPDSEPTNEGRGWFVGVASVCCGACGNGLQQSRQAEAPWALGCIPSAMPPRHRAGKNKPRGIEREKRKDVASW
ncbi:hypothetical protein [Parapedobacter sp. 10938]|uniref:hypothetical protein n=1 Tax=Parapedobacter flavus TaxID=3110225 RepID=UPI002DBE327D|nr:hypothetical protein [Parapedobacter sp. 10938]MEC3881029.1 hypothetical protein [Parapedobacter sp. 10938]